MFVCLWRGKNLICCLKLSLILIPKPGLSALMTAPSRVVKSCLIQLHDESLSCVLASDNSSIYYSKESQKHPLISSCGHTSKINTTRVWICINAHVGPVFTEHFVSWQTSAASACSLCDGIILTTAAVWSTPRFIICLCFIWHRAVRARRMWARDMIHGRLKHGESEQEGCFSEQKTYTHPCLCFIIGLYVCEGDHKLRSPG